MTTTEKVAEATNCPSWCTNHDDRSGTHETAAVATTEDGTFFYLATWIDDDEGVQRVLVQMMSPGGDVSFDTAEQAREAATALLAAADRLDEITGER